MRRKSPDMEFVEDRFCIRGFRVYIILQSNSSDSILPRTGFPARFRSAHFSRPVMTRALGSVTIFPSIMKLYSNDAKSVRSSASSHTSPIRYFGSNEISSHGVFFPGLYKSRQTSFARPCTRIRTPSASCVTPSGYRILFLFRILPF